MDTDPHRLTKLRNEIELNVRLMRGHWRHIVKVSGCRPSTLTRLAADPDYDPQVSELAKLDAYFVVHGVSRKGSPAVRQGVAGRMRARRDPNTVDAFSGTADREALPA